MLIIINNFFTEFSRLKLFLLIFILSIVTILLSLWLGGLLATTLVVIPAILAILQLTKEVWTPEGGGKSKVGLASLGVALVAIVAVHKWRPFIDSLLTPLYGKYPSLKDTLPVESPSIAALVFLVIVILIVNYFARDTTAMKEHPTPIDKEFPEKSYKHYLKSFTGVLLDDLNKIDRETNWSAEAFTPLDAEVEVISGAKRQKRVTDLLSAISSEHKSRVFLILGDPGSGKSVALRKLCRDLLKEVERTGRLPLYVNLREWEMEAQWSEKTPPTVAQLYDFVLNNLKARGDVFANEFVDKYFKKMFENGRLFIVLDSFDEIPAVLDVAEGSWLIESLSDVIYRFLAGAHDSRGILASRIFRKPTNSFAAKMTLEIRPFTEAKIVETLEKSLYYDKSLINLLFNEHPEFVSIARNPFTSALISSYAKEHNNTLPLIQSELYSSYIHRRFTQCGDKIKSKGLTEQRILDCATEIADVMLSTEALGLEASIKALAQKLPSQPVEEAVQVLRYARLGRLGGGDEQRFSFVHRRFNEYFVVQKLKTFPTRIPKDAIPTDSRWRDALVLYCEIAEEDSAREIADFCWAEAQKIAAPSVSLNDPQYLRSVHCLRFLKDSFHSRLKSIRHFQDELRDCVKGQLSLRNDLISRKIAVEAVGLLNEKDMDSILKAALDMDNSWLNETALKSCRYLPRLSFELENRIVAYIESIELFSFARHSRDLVFSFSLSNAFTQVKSYCKWKMVNCYSLLLSWLLITLWRPQALGLFACIYVLGATGFLSTSDGNKFFSRRRDTALFHLILHMQFALTIVLAGVLILTSFQFRSTQKVSINNWIFFIIPLTITSLLTLPFYQLYFFRRAIKQVFSLSSLVILVSGVGITFVGTAIIFILIPLLPRISIPELIKTIAMGVFIAAMAILTLVTAIQSAWTWIKDYRNFGILRVRPLLDREQISSGFAIFETDYWRHRFVKSIQERRIKPAGPWPDGVIPNVNNDSASTLLARLEEGWLGLDR